MKSILKIFICSDSLPPKPMRCMHDLDLVMIIWRSLFDAFQEGSPSVQRGKYPNTTPPPTVCLKWLGLSGRCMDRSFSWIQSNCCLTASVQSDGDGEKKVTGGRSHLKWSAARSGDKKLGLLLRARTWINRSLLMQFTAYDRGVGQD
jgi:hypothetical protein